MSSLVRIDITIPRNVSQSVSYKARKEWETWIFGTEHIEEGWQIHEEYTFDRDMAHFTGLVDNRTAQMTMAFAQGELEAYLALEESL